MDSFLEGLLNILGKSQDKYEPLAPLSKDEAKEWDDLQNEVNKIKSFILEVEAKKRLFWARIEKKLNNYNHDLKIENGMILEKVEEKKNCQNPGIAQPGFCDGNCEDCSLNPDLLS